MKRSLAVLLAGVLAACNGTSQSKYDQQQTQVAITPTGSIVGRVLEVGTSNPLGGVTVTLNAPTVVTTTTTDTGTFSFTGVVVSSAFDLVFEKGGYLRTTTQASVPGSVNYAGSTPLAGGVTTVDVSLAKSDGSITGIVFLPNSKPAVNATLVVDQRRSYLTNGGGNNIGESVVTAKSGADGSFTLTGLAEAPAGITHQVTVQWFDENGDMQADYGSFITSVTVTGTDPSRVFLRYTDIGQTVIASNVFDGEVGATDTLDFTFALPVLTSAQNQGVINQVTLVDTTTNVQVAVDQTWASPVKVSAKPVGTLKESDLYRVTVNVTQTNGNVRSFAYNFQVRATTVTPPTGQVTNFAVTNPARVPANTFDYYDNAFTLSFNPVAGSALYYIYAKDTTDNQSFVLITSYNLSLTAGRPSFNVGLPYAFNRGQPLSNGNKVTFAVVAIDGYGNSAPLSSAPPVTVADNIQPRTANSSPIRVGPNAPDAINDTTAASTIQLRLQYNEPMDPTSAPVFTNSGGAVTQSFVWDNGALTGVMTLNIPVGGDLTGPFTIRGGKDLAGNVLAAGDFTGVLGGRKELLLNGSFEDAAGACNITNWNATGTPAPVSVPNNNSPLAGKCGAMLGSPIGSTPVTGLVKISQDVVLPDITNGLGWGYEWHLEYRTEYQTTGTAAAVTQRCRFTDTADVLVSTIFAYSSATNGGFAAAGGTLAPAQTIRLQCEVNNATTNAANAAIFLDNASITLVKPGSF